jgi:hypothetical protein
MEHEASVAISLVSSPSFSKVLIKIYCIGYGAMFADTKTLTLAGLEEEKEKTGGVMGRARWWWDKPPILPLAPLCG